MHLKFTWNEQYKSNYDKWIFKWFSHETLFLLYFLIEFHMKMNSHNIQMKIKCEAWKLNVKRSSFTWISRGNFSCVCTKKLLIFLHIMFLKSTSTLKTQYKSLDNYQYMYPRYKCLTEISVSCIYVQCKYASLQHRWIDNVHLSWSNFMYRYTFIFAWSYSCVCVLGSYKWFRPLGMMVKQFYNHMLTL